MSYWIIWLGVAILLLIVELLTGSAAALCMAAGCLLPVVASALGAPVWVQILCAVVGSLLALVFLGPLIRRIYARGDRGIDTASNMDALIGREGKVTHEVTNHADDHGRVQIDGDSWLAFTTSPEAPLPRGSQVVVEAYDSLVIRVRPLTK